jgi:hypothetical protein
VPGPGQVADPQVPEPQQGAAAAERWGRGWVAVADLPAEEPRVQEVSPALRVVGAERAEARRLREPEVLGAAPEWVVRRGRWVPVAGAEATTGPLQPRARAEVAEAHRALLREAVAAAGRHHPQGAEGAQPQGAEGARGLAARPRGVAAARQPRVVVGRAGPRRGRVPARTSLVLLGSGGRPGQTRPVRGGRAAPLRAGAQSSS